MKVHDQAYVTLATNDSYALGALVLGHSLKESGTNRELAIIITPMVTQSMRNHLNAVYDHITCVDVLESQDDANLALIRRPELGVTFTKIKCWTLTQYRKCVYLDSDCLVLKNCDELFEHAEISAVPDIGWPDCFNSGMFVFVPSHKTYKQLLNLAMTQGSFDGGDQGLLNSYFSDWRTKDIKNHLSFIYNMASSATYTYLAAYRRYMNDIKIIHFLGPVKPWNCSFDAASGHVNISGCQDPYRAEHLQKWWNIYLKHLHGMLDPKFNSLLGTLPASQTFTASFVPPRKLSDKEHKDAWEGGRIDYLGADAFENIQKHIESQVHHINITNNKMFEKNSILPFDIPNNNLVSNDNSMNSLKNGAQSHSSCASTKVLGQNNVNLVGGGSRERGLYFDHEPDSNLKKDEDKIGFGELNNNNLREFEEGTENSNFIAKKSAADVTPAPVILTSSPNLSNKLSNDIAPKVLSHVYNELPKLTPSTCVISPDTQANTTVDVRASSNDLGYKKSISTDTKEQGWLSYFGVTKIFNLIPIFKQHLMRMPTISMNHEMSDSKNRYVSSLNTKTVTRSHSPSKDYGDIQVISYAENDKPEIITTYHVPLIQPSVKVNEPTKAIALSVTVKNDNSTSSLKKTS